MPPITIEYSEAGVAILRLCDPDNENALTTEFCSAWLDSMHCLAPDSELRVLVIAGLPKVFCSGASTATLEMLSSGSFDVRDLELPDRILSFPVPVIAAMEGHAVGGGLVAALCCDLVIAASEKRYGLNFTELGFTPGMGITGLLPALAGHHLAAEMLLTGRFFQGDELVRRGLFNAAVPSTEVFALSLDLARQLKSKPRHVLEMTKSALAEPRRAILAKAMSREHLMHRICFSPQSGAVREEVFLATGGSHHDS
ncbi:MAG: polyketide synthase [Terracidiphilus sp.]